MDECTNFKLSHFYQRKDLKAESTCELLEGWRSNGIVTKYIRLDYAGKNKLFEQCSKSADWEFNWQFDY